MTMRRYEELDNMESLAVAIGATCAASFCSALSKKKHSSAPASLASSPRVARCGIAISRGSADERRMVRSTRALHSTIVSRAKEPRVGLEPGTFHPMVIYTEM